MTNDSNEQPDEPNPPRSGSVNEGAQRPVSFEITDDEAASGASPGDAERPHGLLRACEKFFLILDRWIGRVVPESLNPLLHTGAIAVVTFLIATVTGIVLLIWYRPSVNMAFDSVEAMSTAPFTAGFIRSLHRYSSDATVFFTVVHAIRFFFERRFGGARWLAWVTGVLMLGTLWSIGWTGYWLVWDLRAQSLAVGTAKLVDMLPVFADPLGRSFLTDEGVNSLLFFVVFFFHMMIPLGMSVILWIHITRLARARFLTQRPMTIWIIGSLIALCALYPASSAERAQMTALPRDMTIDWWYLMPLAFTDRLSGGALWAIALIAGAVIISLPWWLAGRRPKPASVVGARCNECRKCYTDCPYEAIQMVKRTEGNAKYPTMAEVIESKCVSCGICAGSCDTAGVGLLSFDSIEQRRRVDGWLEEAERQQEPVHVVYACAESAAANLTIDASTGLCDELPGHRVLPVPCAGWVQPLLVERAVRRGAQGVLIVTCGPGECLYREGAQWTVDRMEGRRLPHLRTDHVDPARVTILGLDRTQKPQLIEQARALAGGQAPAPRSERSLSSSLTIAAATLLALVCAGIMGAVSDLGYASPIPDGSELVVSFSHPGAVSEDCQTLSEEELAALPVHMRKAVNCERRRSPVRLAITIDGDVAVRRDITPSGLWKDGNSVVVERLPISAGEHVVEVAIGDTSDPEEWNHSETRTIEFSEEARRVVTFDRLEGFGWH